MTVTGAVSWRRGDIMYKNNEIYVDIVEDVNLLMSNTGERGEAGNVRPPGWCCLLVRRD